MDNNKVNENYLFNFDDLDLMNMIISNNSDILMNIEEYNQLSSKCSDLLEEFEKLDEPLKQSFEDFELASLQTKNYELSLMYHLGIKKGLEMQKLK